MMEAVFVEVEHKENLSGKEIQELAQLWTVSGMFQAYCALWDRTPDSERLPQYRRFARFVLGHAAPDREAAALLFVSTYCPGGSPR